MKEKLKQAKQLNLHDVFKSYTCILLKYPSDTGIVVASWIADKTTFRFGFYDFMIILCILSTLITFVDLRLFHM